MAFEPTPRVIELAERITEFMDEHIYPNESVYEEQALTGGWDTEPAIIAELKAKAQAAGLWNLFLPDSDLGFGLSNLEYAPLCEIMGRSRFAAEAFNCSAPDTGNMEVLERYGTEEHKKTWLEPLLAGEIRSAFAMTEPEVASSDATNIQSRIERDGDDYVINGHKWWISGAGDPRCKILIFMGKTDPSADRHKQQSMILVPKDTPGVNIIRAMQVFGNDHRPHGHMEIRFENVRVPASNLLLGEGRGFEIAQGRLGPGRIHHCMRLIGAAERSLEAMCQRADERVAFGRAISTRDTIREDIANSRMEIDQSRLLVLNAADKMDNVGNKEARSEISQIKVVVPNMAQTVIDRAIQVHGAAGISQDFNLADFWMYARICRLADGPDAVHRGVISKLELRRQAEKRGVLRND